MFGKVKKLHFIGIGGIGMSGLAIIMKNLGFQVTGSDLKRSATTDTLEKMGIAVRYEHGRENITDCEVVVYSSAIDPSNPEMIEARQRSLTVVPRGEMLAELMRMKIGIAIAGTHGKTTTTSIVGRIMEVGGLAPTTVVGGIVKNGGNASLGKGEYLVCEADESDKSFLFLTPSYAVITNVEAEHLDHYKNLAEIEDHFVIFANRVPFWGCVFLCSAHPVNQKIRSRIERRVLTYGFDEGADIRAADVTGTGWGSRFAVHAGGRKAGVIELSVPGTHNVLNSLAGVAIGLELGIPFDKIAPALKSFAGVHRRLELVGEAGSVKVFDDYGHHPTEIAVTLETLRSCMPDRRIVSVFQPHRYTRTYHLIDQFAKSFFAADLIIVTDIYAASEKPIPGVNGEALARRIEQEHGPVIYLKDQTAIIDYLKNEIESGDVVITQGAGNIWQVGQELLKCLRTR